MTFNSQQLQAKPGEIIAEDRFRQVEMAIGFKKLTCHRCEFAAIYKYRALHLRRKDQLATAEDEEIRPDHEQIWAAIPRFAEIPETIHCKHCQEVIGLYTECVF